MSNNNTKNTKKSRFYDIEVVDVAKKRVRVIEIDSEAVKTTKKPH